LFIFSHCLLQTFRLSAPLDCASSSGVIFIKAYTLNFKDGIVGTTKLTRKEILAEDPVHGGILWLIEIFGTHRKAIGVAAIIIIVAALGAYGGAQYLGAKQLQAQEQLGKGIDLFHAAVAPDATAASQGLTPTFKSDAEKYQAAAKEFSAVADSGLGNSKLSVIARYYLGLSQLQLGQKKEAIRNLETVSTNSKERTIGNLAKRTLARSYQESGNAAQAAALLEGMIKDAQCDLPKEDLAIQLSKIFVAQGNRDKAIQVLREASTKVQEFSSARRQLTMELDKLQNSSSAGIQP
jgi:tetratricopeptide (TPR) repeat protein